MVLVKTDSLFVIFNVYLYFADTFLSSKPVSFMFGEESDPLGALLARTTASGGIELIKQRRASAKVEQNPIIVFDRVGTDSSDDTPITLGVRQPSFVSLGELLVPKGSGSMAEFEPVIEEVEKSNVPVTGIIEEEEFQQQTALVNELKLRNLERWKRLGYEPPENLLGLVRAASHIAFQTEEVDGSGTGKYGSTTKLEQLKPARKFTLMQDLIEEVDEEAVIEEEDREPFPSNMRFDELTEELTAPVRHILATGELREDDDIQDIRRGLRDVVDACSEELWVIETQYVNGLIAETGKSKNSGPVKAIGFHRKDPEEDISGLRRVNADIMEHRDDEVSKLKKELEVVLDHIHEEYMAAAEDLDNEFQSPVTFALFGKPSKELLELRLVAKRLLKQNKIKEAERTIAAVRSMEAAEGKRIGNLLRKKYHEKDLHLKETFARRREIVIGKYWQKVKEAEKQYNEDADIIAHRIAKIEAEIGHRHVPLERRMLHWEDHEEEGVETADEQEGDRPGSKATSTCSQAVSMTQGLAIQAPALLRRDRDVAVLQQMTEAMINKQPLSRGDIDIMFRIAGATNQL